MNRFGQVHDEGFINFFSSPHVIGIIELRKIKWAGLAARIETIRDYTKSIR
jgi:hypothetical protein